MTRDRLPQRRAAETFDFDHVNHAGASFPYKATIGFYDDGRVGEVFLYAGKVGTELDVSIKDAAIILSFALQHGARAEDIRAAMTRDAVGRPEGVMGTLLDLIAKRPEAPIVMRHYDIATPP